MRFKGLDVPNNLYASVQEVISATAITGAPSHIVHIQSTGNRTTPELLRERTQHRLWETRRLCLPVTRVDDTEFGSSYK